MRTAIITFQDAQNYGAVLQAYALKTAVSAYSDTTILNYFNPYFHRNMAGHGIKCVIKTLLKYRSSKIKTSKFNTFQQQYLTGEQELLLRDFLMHTDLKFDYYITGSDQVWNLDCSGKDTTYFLDFVKSGKKCSYAASLGNYEATNKKVFQKYLKDFYAISVREDSGREILQSAIDKKISITLDPTLLLDKEEWGKRFNLKFEEKYVLVYEVVTGHELFEQAKTFVKFVNLPLICITDTDKLRIGAKVIKDASPEQWLKLFAGAAYVFTNSFHGVAFSLNFNKQFFVELLPLPAKKNTRIIEMLNRVGITQRLASECMVQKPLNYNNINERMNLLRVDSHNYIKNLFAI